MFTNLENLKKAIESNDKKGAKKVLAIMCENNEYKMGRALMEKMLKDTCQVNFSYEKFNLLVDLLEAIGSKPAREELIIKTFYPLHRTEGIDSWRVFLIFDKNEPKENIEAIACYYGMDESYYMGVGYGFGCKPEIIKKGSRILVKQYRGLDI